MPRKIKIFQIFYDQETKKKLAKRFIPLDNSANERPDWYEFWPIRQYLRSEALDPETFYGFLSPNFYEKTKISDHSLIITLKSIKEDCDVFLVTYSPIQNAIFRNVFFQGEFNHPGLIDISNTFLKTVNIEIDVTKIVTDLTSSVFANYVIARPNYWIKWLDLTEKFFEFAENPENGLTDKQTYYKNRTMAPMKTFIQERLSSIVLLTNNLRTVVPTEMLLQKYDPAMRDIILSLDSHKRKFCETLDPKELEHFHEALHEKRFTLGFLMSQMDFE